MINAWMHGIIYVAAMLGVSAVLLLISVALERLSDNARMWLLVGFIAVILLVVLPVMVGYSAA